VERAAERKEIAARVERLAEDLLGTHHAQRSADLTGLRFALAIRGASDSEIGELHLAAQREKDVRRLHIAMHDAQARAVLHGERVRVGESAGDALHDAERLRDGELPVRVDEVLRGHAVDQLECEEPVLLLAAEVDDGNDVRMLEAHPDARLVEEHLDHLLLGDAGCRAGEHAFDGDRPGDPGDGLGFRAIDDAHPACPKDAEQPVAPVSAGKDLAQRLRAYYIRDVSRLRTSWGRWVAFLGEREGAESLALARMIAGLTLAYHLVAMWTSGSADAMWVDIAHGGYRSVDEGWFGFPFDATPGAIHAVMALTSAAAVFLAFGIFTRVAAVIAWFGFSRLCDLNWQCGGSSDELLTNGLFLLMLSGCGETWSIDAWRRGGEPATVPAWPRRLLVLQLVILYFMTALQKVSSSWIPFVGPMDALWYILQQPTWQRRDMRWLAPFFPLTQLATFTTWFFEMFAPLLLLAMWYRRTPAMSGRVRALFNRIPFRNAYLGLGLALHLGIWASLEVGPFLGGILALYAACFLPHEWRALATRVRERIKARSAVVRPAP